jgi:hypothetical protein
MQRSDLQAAADSALRNPDRDPTDKGVILSIGVVFQVLS